ncbi:uncharacterized protein [Rutidosis leptorrhynchoides]|uniref:uncharacterized protein isoform X2 n=1 Tax=Rutidosis leptorrhynchoides TaxID=125765 RepID=UPI003A99BFC9
MQSGQVSSQGNGGTIGPTFLYSVFDSMTFFISETGTDALSILKQTYELPDGAIAMINDRHYIDAMKQCFLLHKGPLLEFSLLALEQTVEFDQLISHLSMKNTLQMLSLEMLNEDSLPLSIFSMQQLTKLSLCKCCINHHSKIKGFKNLTSLYLRDVKISRKTLLHLVSSCPLLKSFTLFIHDILGNHKSSICDLIERLPVIERLITHTGVSDNEGVVDYAQTIRW